MSTWIAQQVRFGLLKPNTPFYMVNPVENTHALPFYPCADLEDNALVWTVYEPWAKCNPCILTWQEWIDQVKTLLQSENMPPRLALTYEFWLVGMYKNGQTPKQALERCKSTETQLGKSIALLLAGH